MSKGKEIKKEEKKTVVVDLTDAANQVLNRSAGVNLRAKKNEARLRLEDHLKRFPEPNWSQVN